MADFILWLIIVTVLGWLAFPICFTFFNKACDRGFSVAKVIGVLLWGYIYWLGNISGLLSNSRAGALSVLLLLGVISFFFIRKQGIGKILDWVKTNSRLVIWQEAVFICAFLIWAVVRGANPEISGTEKPMELAFINGIYQSRSFPPNDPWLSEYAISYYYFGYLIIAALMHLLGTASGVAFNLGISLTFGLVAASSWGILVNLLVQKAQDAKGQLNDAQLRRIMLLALLAPLFILILGNAEGFLEMLHSRGLFWNENLTASGFWQWLDIQDLTNPPSLPLDWNPSRLGGNWWWRASRVLQDYTAAGQSREIIDEFPFFSYLLADLHPHVLAMPAVLLAIYAGFYVLRFSVTRASSLKILDYLKSADVWFLAFITGSLIFLNTWDFPIYFGLISLAFIIPVIRKQGWKKERLLEFFAFAIPFGLACIFLFLPFLVGLSSQAGGFLPSLVFRTRAVHFLVMFFPLIIPVSVFVGVKAIHQGIGRKVGVVFLFCLAGAACLFMVGLAIPAVSDGLPRWLPGFGDAASQTFASIFGAGSMGELIVQSIERLAEYPWLVVYLLLLISVTLVMIFQKPGDHVELQTESRPHSSADDFVLLLILTGAMLTLVPEFFYLRDQFGWRMNTIFKFYFQIWILFAVAAAYAIANIAFIEKKWKTSILSVCSMLLIGIGLVYPAYAVFDKTNSFRNIEWSLDGNKFYQRAYPSEMEAIEYLKTLPFGTIAEAIGGSYSGYGRVSKITGYPTVLGWPGHELQWRGGSMEMGSRESDIKLLYETDAWETAMWVLDHYSIDYVFIGSMENNAYQVREEKFADNLSVIYQNNDAVIYSYNGIK